MKGNTILMKSLNIFTDASITKTDQFGTVGCAGFVSAIGDPTNLHTKLETLDKGYTILLNTTNNISEATGVLKAVQYAIANRNNYNQINIFSDSQWCIRSLTSWIFNWISTIDKNGIMYGSSGDPVINQNLLAEIIVSIVQSNTRIHFYHCKGHVKNDSNSIFEALKTFKISNHIGRDVSLTYNQIYIMAYYNDMVDRESRQIVTSFFSDSDISKIYPIDQPRPFYYILNRDIIETYKHLIDNNIRF